MLVPSLLPVLMFSAFGIAVEASCGYLEVQETSGEYLDVREVNNEYLEVQVVKQCVSGDAGSQQWPTMGGEANLRVYEGSSRFWKFRL